ncbi:sensor histidine kinase [Phenylobacterium sp.]|uniref:sensor histidine kinase n=1 Tax=Phenylobacterium sp. TaxID=1871053 RepID=UPI002C4DE830|nr:HWE histidine kinase domain-containing protein [Phenylobacterium sp.]HVI30585.1 HWE histidine kinase domain-containing protein [Phenylobacterium sp.]
MSRRNKVAPSFPEAPDAVPPSAWSVLLRRADQGLVIVDRDWRIRFCSPAAQRRLMRGPAVQGGHFWDSAAPLFDPATRRRFRRAQHQRTSAEAVLPAGSGEWLHVELVCDGEVSAILARSATRKLRLQARAEEQQERMLALVESLSLAHRAAHAATWEWRAGDVLRWTDLEAARDLIGIPKSWHGSAVPRDWRELVIPEDRPLLDEAILRTLVSGEGRFPFRATAADGSLRWLEASAVVAERTPAGQPVRLVGVTMDITERRAGEVALEQEVVERRRAEERQRLLVGELNHRVKNTLATVQSMARQTLRGSPEAKRAFEEFEGRLLALSWAHDVLTAEGWSGAEVAELVQRTLSPHEGGGADRLTCRGPRVRLEPQIALAVSLALHELATNALKYGALSQPSGRVQVRWRAVRTDGGKALELEWRERGGPPVQPPSRTGFGTRLLRHGLAAELGEPVELRYEPEGLVCRLRTTRGVAWPKPAGRKAASPRAERPPAVQGEAPTAAARPEAGEAAEAHPFHDAAADRLNGDRPPAS